MKKIIHKSENRGFANYGWLKTSYSFSFANYYDPKKMGFGALRVLNDDFIDAGGGFDMHSHDNMEIITVVMKGSLKHKDSMGNEYVISEGEVQVMSAGTGVTHAELNDSSKKPVELFQIWIMPEKYNIEPRYDQKSFNNEKKNKKCKLLVSGDKKDKALWINQNAKIYLGDLEKGKEATFNISCKDNGAYVFLISGEAKVAGENLNERDAVGVYDAESVEIKPKKDSKILIIDVPII